MRLRPLIAAGLVGGTLAGVVSDAAPGTALNGRPITIGVLADCVGPFGFTQSKTAAGADLPLLERGAKLVSPTPTDGVKDATVAGRSVRLVFGCADGTSVSGLAEARRLVESAGADVVIGPVTGDEELSLQAYARRRPGTAFINGSGSSQVLDPAPNFFSFHTDGAQWTAGLGSYAYHTLGWRNVVELVDPDIFDWAQAAGFDAEFCSLGGSILKRIWINPSTSDFTDAIGRVPHSGVNGFFVASGTRIETALANNYIGLRGNVSKRLLGGVLSDPPQPALGTRINGQVIAERVGGPHLAAFDHRLLQAFPSANRFTFAGDVFVLDYYTAMKATLAALVAVGGDLSHGERRLRAALARLRLVTPTGVVTLDADHQAVAPNYLRRVDRWDGTKETPVRTIRRVDPTFGGYFTKRDGPPGPTTPVCRRRRPPPWAR